MKKVIGQTVRDLKRGVNKKVLKVPGIEQKVLDATNNEAWGPHGALLADLAKASLNFHEHQMIMNVIWKRINDTGKNWRHVYKALTVLEYLVAHGSERVIDEIREHAYQIATLSNFQYVDSSGRDQGSNIRRKSQILVALVNDKERIQEVRQKANANRDKYQSTGPAGSAYKPGYGDRHDDDNREGRYGYKDDERNGSERERDDGYRSDDKYGRGRESYSRDGDRYGRDHEEQNGRDGYRNDDYGGRGTDESRGSVDRYTDRSADDDDRYSTKSGGGRGDGQSHDERRLEQHLSEDNFGGPPSYEEATKNVQNHTSKERDGEAVVSPKDESASHAAPKPSSSREVASQSPNHAAYSESLAAPSVEVDAFDEFDPRGSVSASLPPASSPELDFFGSLSTSDSTNSLALMPAISASTTAAAVPVNSDFGMDFAAPSASFNVSCETSENPFGDPPFKATPGDGYQAQPQTFTPVHSTQVSNGSELFPSNMGTVPGFDFGDMLGGLSFTSQAGDGQHYSSTAAFSAPEMPLASESNDILDGILPRTDSATNISSHTTEHAAPNDSHFHESGPPAMFPSQEHPISSQAAQSAGTSDMQPHHLNFFQQEVSAPSQTAPISSHAAQPPIPDNMQSSHPNSLQQHGVPVPASLPPQTAPVSSQAAQPTNTNSTQSDHLNFLPQGVSSAASVPSQEAPVVSQAAQPTDASNMQSAQFNFFEQPGSSSADLPPMATQSSSQSVQAAAPNNMQLDHFNNFDQPTFSASAPFSSQAVQSAAPDNFESTQLNPIQQAGVPTPPPPQGAPTTFGSPAKSQPNNTQLDHFNNFQQPAFSASVPFSSQAQQPPAPSNIHATQLNPVQQGGVPTPPPLQGAPTKFGPPAEVQPNNMQLDRFNNFQQPAFSASVPFSSQAAQPPAPSNVQATQLNPLQQAGASKPPALQGAPSTFRPPAKAQPVKFEPKSTVWTDTLNRGLVDLNISGPKTNPLSDIGVDFDSINRKEKRMEARSSAAPVTSTITMGKAMGTGSGRTGATGIPPAPNPMVASGMGMGMGTGGGANMGMGMGGYGGGMNQPPMGMNMGGYGRGMNQPPMGMNMGGYGGGMNQPSMGMNMGSYGGGMNQPSVGMNMGMGQGAQMQAPTGMPQPAPGMPGFGYNPMMGMNNYGSQQQNGGGAPQQQPFGGGYR